MYGLAARLDPESLFALARAVYGEMALAGICAVGEFHYVHHDPSGRPYGEPNAMGAALMQAASEAGVRLTLLDTCYLRGGFDRPLDGPQKRFGDGDALAWARRAGTIEVSGDTVVLPQPEGPTKTAISPSGTSRLKLSTAVVPSAKRLLTESKVIMKAPTAAVQLSLP
jgi:cytosine/adenosine deaminase-related metal-dependent hydrolase